MPTIQLPQRPVLTIISDRLGKISEITEFLKDIETAYNSIYAFEFIVESISEEHARNLKYFEQTLDELRQLSNIYRNVSIQDSYTNALWHNLRFQSNNSLPNLLSIQSDIDMEKLIHPNDVLTISKVNIQSLGFWEFIGSLNPMQQLREYLNDRHSRRKDLQYRDRQEQRLGELAIEEKENILLNQRISTLRSLGYSETEIRQFVMSMVLAPLSKLDKHQDNGLIQNSEE